MKAAIHKNYSPPSPIIIKETSKPDINENDLLIKVHAATFNRTDCANVSAKPWIMRLTMGFFKPRNPISGTDFAGVIEDIGSGVKGFKKGDKVFGFDDSGLSSHAEYMKFAAEDALAIMPDNVSFEEAAACIEGAHYAYNFINKVKLQKGQKVMVNGASGAIGSAMVQLLVTFDVEVTATCATKNIELIKSLGVSHVIDYTKEDFTKINERFDYVFDSVGKSTFGKCKAILKPNGIYISSELGPFVQNIYLPLITRIKGGKRVKFPLPLDQKRSVLLIKKMMEEDNFRPVIDSVYSLSEIEEAYAYVSSGQKTGNVIIKIVES